MACPSACTEHTSIYMHISKMILHQCVHIYTHMIPSRNWMNDFLDWPKLLHTNMQFLMYMSYTHSCNIYIRILHNRKWKEHFCAGPDVPWKLGHVSGGNHKQYNRVMIL